MYEKFMGFPTLPVAVGPGGTLIPRPERLYFWFGEPIDATRFGTSADDHAAAQALHEEVKQAVVMGIQFLRDERDRDPKRSSCPGYWSCRAASGRNARSAAAVLVATPRRHEP